MIDTLQNLRQLKDNERLVAVVVADVDVEFAGDVTVLSSARQLSSVIPGFEAISVLVCHKGT